MNTDSMSSPDAVTDSDALSVQSAFGAARRRAAGVESIRQRDGGVYDPLLCRWVSTSEANRKAAL